MKPLKAANSTLHEFAESTTIHGIAYVFDRAIKGLDNILWFLVVCFGAGVAVYMSLDAWNTWKDAPVLTSVSSTGLPLRKIDFPAITICSQGLIQDVIDKSLVNQFNNYLKKQNLDPYTMSEADREAAEDAYTQALYPGSTTAPQSLINVLTSENPTETIKAKIVTDPNSVCVDVPSTCDPPWFSPLPVIPHPELMDVCVANYGKTKASEDLCLENGGETIMFDSTPPTGAIGVTLSTELSTGQLNDVKLSPFWFNMAPFNPLFDGNTTYTINGDNMADLYEFQNQIYGSPGNPGNPVNISSLDPEKEYCAIAWLTAASIPDFSYDLVDCDGSTEAYRICFRQPVNCSASDQTLQAGRKKRENDPSEASLDNIFKNKKTSGLKLESTANQAKAAYKESFKKMNLDKSYPSLFEILWYTQLPCFDVENVTSEFRDQYGMLKGCFWKGVEVPCSKVFDTFPTDQGMCCTFNINKAEEMFTKGKYNDMVNFMQVRDRNMSFDRNSSMPIPWREHSVQENIEPISEAGRSKGLQVILDAHSNLLAGGTVPEDFDGFYAIIDSSDQYPMTTRKSVLLRPGHNNFVSMSATKITSNEGIKGIKPQLRTCYFSDEKKMNVHKNYTQANCMLECQLTYAASKMNQSDPCIPWYFPINDTSTARLCDPWEARSFRNYMTSIPYDTCDFCLPDCITTMYSASVTAAPFRRCDYKNLGVSFLCNFDDQIQGKQIQPPIWGSNVLKQYIADIETIPEYLEDLSSHSNKRLFQDAKASGKPIFMAANVDANGDLKSYDAYDKDIAMVTFFFETNTVFEFSRDMRMTMVGYISQMGGLLGLWMGFSFISAVEIIYWCTIRLTRNM